MFRFLKMSSFIYVEYGRVSMEDYIQKTDLKCPTCGYVLLVQLDEDGCQHCQKQIVPTSTIRQ